MPTVRLTSLNDFAEWRANARVLLRAAFPPGEVTWVEPGAADMFEREEGLPPKTLDKPAGRVPRRFVALARTALCHADPDRFGLLYKLLWRLQKDRGLLANRDDVDVGKLHRRVDAVTAEVKRLQQELRFRYSVDANGQKGLAAWFEPKHYVLELSAPLFSRTHGHEQWWIGTPYRTAFWDGKALSFGPGRMAPGTTYTDTGLVGLSASPSENRDQRKLAGDHTRT